MAIGGKTVGPDTLPTVLVSDPVTASQYGSVPPVADATSLAGKSAQLTLAVPFLENTGGTYDLARSAPGTTGIPSVNTEGVRKTYSCASLAFTPVATATDIWTLVGSGTKTGRLLRVTVSGIATSATSVDLQLVVRSTADSGGTATQPTAVPNDSNNLAATLVANLYSVNPTLGNAVGSIRGRKLNLGATGAAGTVEWIFTTANDQAPVIRGTSQNIALNWNGQAVPSGTLLDIEAEWSEE